MDFCQKLDLCQKLSSNIFADLFQKGGTCGYMISPTVDNWMTDVCGSTSYGYACEKMKGNQCPQGWTFFSSPD